MGVAEIHKRRGKDLCSAKGWGILQYPNWRDSKHDCDWGLPGDSQLVSQKGLWWILRNWKLFQSIRTFPFPLIHALQDLFPLPKQGFRSLLCYKALSRPENNPSGDLYNPQEIPRTIESGASWSENRLLDHRKREFESDKSDICAVVQSEAVFDPGVCF